jgi:hypothetical protein
MYHDGIDYDVRVGIGRDQWTLLIQYPTNANGVPRVVHISGTRDEANASARQRIDSWLKRQRRRLALDKAS